MFSGAWPWDLSEAGAWLAAARWLWLVGLLSSGGALLFAALEPATKNAAQLRLIRVSLGFAGVAGLAWMVAQAGSMAGLHIAAWQTVILQTEFGRSTLLQLALLALARLALGAPPVLPAALAMAAVGLQVAHLHGWAMDASLGRLTVAESLHVTAAAAWLGSLLPLRLALRAADKGQALALLRRYSVRATLFVLVLAGSAVVQGNVLLGGLPGIFGSVYGWTTLSKLILLFVLLRMAVRHRWQLLPALSGADPAAARRSLRRSIGWEAVAGAVVIAAAALLSVLTPGMHAQPVWPFAWQFSLSAAWEDADIARELLLAGAALSVAAVLACYAALRRAARWATLAGVAVLAIVAAPHLSPLFVPATATTFYRSPTGFAAAGIAEGAAQYSEHCARCHGADGRGDGPDAARLALPPADLTAAHLWDHADGELFSWLQDGITATDGTPVMPGFATLLTAEERWQLIDFLRAHNAGLARAALGFWPQRLRAPDLDADCANGRSVSLADLRGRAVRLVFQSDAPVAPNTTAVTVLVPRPGATDAAGGDCIAADPSVSAAYAVISGLRQDELAGTELFIDSDGLLRDVRRTVPPVPALTQSN